MEIESTVGRRRGRELLGWFILSLGAAALQLPALGRMAMQGVDILQFETVWTTPEANRLVAMLGSDGLAAARQQLLLDYGYLVLYGITLWKACRLLGDRARRRGPAVVARIAPGFAWAGVAAAVCDAVENTGLYLVTLGHTVQPWPALASGYATAKFTLLGVTLLFLVLGLVATQVASTRQSVPPPADQ